MSAGLSPKTFDKSLQGLLAEHVARASTHVALFGVRLEALPEIDGLFGGVVGQNPTQVVHHHKGVVISFQEPVRVVHMVFVHVVEGSDGFPVELVAALFGAQAHRGKAGVLHGAHEHNNVAVATPGGSDVAGLAL